MNDAVMSIGGEELRKGVPEVITNKRGDDIFITKRDDEEMAGPCGVEVVLPARTGVSAGLWVSRGWRLVLLVLKQFFDRCVLIRDLAVKDHGQFLVVRRIP